MSRNSCSIAQKKIKHKLEIAHLQYLKLGFPLQELENVLSTEKKTLSSDSTAKRNRIVLFICVSILLIFFFQQSTFVDLIFGIRCIVPNNYFIWESTRPISYCNFCSNVTEPIVLHNVSREEFQFYAYTSKPIVVRNSFQQWPALKKFSWKFFKELYADIEESYKSVDEECQFLHFKSDFISVRDVFAMKDSRVRNLPGEKSWYVGWGNCHPTVLKEMRKYYPKPHFLPEDAEIPHKEYIFMGYDDGATMHLDFINRLMWQAQLQGSKIWNLLPPPECQNICNPLRFDVQPGDGVLVDTRIWYHATTIPNGEFSLSIQSEYG